MGDGIAHYQKTRTGTMQRKPVKYYSGLSNGIEGWKYAMVAIGIVALFALISA